MDRWRNETRSIRRSASMSIQICAKDIVIHAKTFEAFVCHIIGPHGKGFMASVRTKKGELSVINNGAVHYGTKSSQYLAARNEIARLKEGIVKEIGI